MGIGEASSLASISAIRPSALYDSFSNVASTSSQRLTYSSHVRNSVLISGRAAKDRGVFKCGLPRLKFNSVRQSFFPPCYKISHDRFSVRKVNCITSASSQSADPPPGSSTLSETSISGITDEEVIILNPKPPPQLRHRTSRRRLRLRARLWLLARIIRRLSSFPKLIHVIGTSIRLHRWTIFVAMAMGVTATLGMLSNQNPAPPAAKGVQYSDFLAFLQLGSVKEVNLQEGSNLLFFNLGEGLSQTSEGIQQIGGMLASASESLGSETLSMLTKPVVQWQFCTRRIARDETYLLPLLVKQGVRFMSAPVPWSRVLHSLAMTSVMLWVPSLPLIYLMYRQLSNDAMSKKKKMKKPQVTRFADVAGVDTAKAELMEVVNCLKGASNYRALGARLPRGVLLVGPPGTGKTLLARAVAGEAEVPFFAASASEFVEMFVGRGAARVRELFAQARKKTPSIVFIDELDAVGGRRGTSFNDERDQTLNQLLTEMDGFDSASGVLVLAATNRVEALDPALCRPGRISRQVQVPLPDLLGREQILAVHMRELPLGGDPETVRKAVALLTPNMAGADLANIVNEAVLLAARRGSSVVILEDMMEAVDRAKYGVGGKVGLARVWQRKLAKWVSNAEAKVGSRQAEVQGLPPGYRAPSV